MMHIDYAMIAQPMAGKTEEEILATRKKATVELQRLGYEVLNTYFTDDLGYAPRIPHPALHLLAKSLNAMSACHAVYFCNGWENARGCRIEHEAAQNYGLTILYEE
jgi:hypothetical protein